MPFLRLLSLLYNAAVAAPALSQRESSRSTRDGRAFKEAFSLVEMSVVVVIVSLVAVMGLEATASYMNRTAYKVTVERLDAIDRAMLEFRRVHNRLPCPFYHLYTASHTCYGKETNGSGGMGTCANTTGACNATALTGGAGFIGHVPVRDLGLPLSTMVDGYGSRIFYTVTTNQVYDATYTPGTPTDNFVNAADGLAVRSGKLDATCGGAGELCQNRGSASYFLFSVGRDKRGGFSPASTTVSVACLLGNDSRIDAVNCRLNNATALAKGDGTIISPAIPFNVFYDSRYNNGTQNGSYFDDIVRWRSKSNL